MRVLLLAYDLSNSASAQSARAGALMRQFEAQGAEIRALCAYAPPLQRGKTPDPRVIRAPAPQLSERRGIHLPDAAIRWRTQAVAAAQALSADWRPDMIYALCPPFSLAMIAAKLSKAIRAPFVTELQAPWFDAPRSAASLVAGVLEGAALRRASGVVAGAPSLAAALTHRYGAARVVFAHHGFDAKACADLPGPQTVDPRRLTVFLDGLDGMADSADPLLRAIADLGPESRRVRIVTPRPASDMAVWRAEALGLGDLIEIGAHETPIDAQRAQADVILVGGGAAHRVFEAVGARRPILAVAAPHSAEAALIRERALGLAHHDGAALTGWLRAAMAEKQTHGRIPALPKSAIAGLSEQEQFMPVARMIARSIYQTQRGLIAPPAIPAAQPAAIHAVAS